MSKTYLIKKLSVENNAIKVEANETFKSKYLNDDFLIEYDTDVKVDNIDQVFLTIPFLLNVIPIVWLSGNEYYIESIDKTLLSSLEKVRQSFQAMYPNVRWTGKLIPDRLVSLEESQIYSELPVSKNRVVGVLFTGGVDSVFTSLNHSEEKQLLITISSFKNAIANKNAWINQQKKCFEFGQSYGHLNTFIKTNFKDFLQRQYLGSIVPDISIWWGQVQSYLGLIGLVAPLLIRKNVRKLLISAGESRDKWGSHPSICNNISWTGFSVELDGYQYLRQAKIQQIIEICQKKALKQPTFRVCDYIETQKDATNCCKCGKCLRTMTSLLIEGQNIKNFGFHISIEEAIKRVKLGYKKDIRSDGRFAIWQALQTRSRDILSTESNDRTSEIESFLSWLEAVDLDSYYSQRKNRQKFRQFIKVTFSRYPAIYRKLYKLDQVFSQLLKIIKK